MSCIIGKIPEQLYRKDRIWEGRTFTLLLLWTISECPPKVSWVHRCGFGETESWGWDPRQWLVPWWAYSSELWGEAWWEGWVTGEWPRRVLLLPFSPELSAALGHAISCFSSVIPSAMPPHHGASWLWTKTSTDWGPRWTFPSLSWVLCLKSEKVSKTITVYFPSLISLFYFETVFHEVV